MVSINTFNLLQNSCLKKVLNEKKSLQKGLEVQLLGHSITMIVQGFVPISLFDGSKSLCLDLYTYLVGLDCVRFRTIKENNSYGNNKPIESYKTYPIYDQVLAAKEEYSIDRNVIINDYSYSSNMRYLYESPNSIPETRKINILKGFENIKEEEGHFVYITNQEFEFRNVYTSSSILISKDFVCLCSFVNSINGQIEFQIFNPDDLIVLLPNKINDEK